jgi:hypothetical protein
MARHVMRARFTARFHPEWLVHASVSVANASLNMTHDLEWSRSKQHPKGGNVLANAAATQNEPNTKNQVRQR